MAALRHRS